MRNKLLLASAALAMALSASSANAAANLIGATVTGSNGSTIWTTTQTGNYALFLQQPIGHILNPNNESISDPTDAGLNSFTIAGEGYYPGQLGASDPAYKLTLNFADGATISGIYNKLSAIPLDVHNATVGGTTYTFGGFAWDRTLSDNVQAYKAMSGGDKSDYAGQFSFSTSAVPEPATWAMMLAGFAMVGLGLRSRRSGVTGAVAA